MHNNYSSFRSTYSTETALPSSCFKVSLYLSPSLHIIRQLSVLTRLVQGLCELVCYPYRNYFEWVHWFAPLLTMVESSGQMATIGPTVAVELQANVNSYVAATHPNSPSLIVDNEAHKKSKLPIDPIGRMVSQALFDQLRLRVQAWKVSVDVTSHDGVSAFLTEHVRAYGKKNAHAVTSGSSTKHELPKPTGHWTWASTCETFLRCIRTRPILKDSLQHDPVGVRCCPTWQWPWLHGWRCSDKTQDRILCCDVEGSLEVELRFCELIEGLEPNWTTTVTTMALVSGGPPAATWSKRWILFCDGYPQSLGPLTGYTKATSSIGFLEPLVTWQKFRGGNFDQLAGTTTRVHPSPQMKRKSSHQALQARFTHVQIRQKMLKDVGSINKSKVRFVQEDQHDMSSTHAQND